MVRSWEERRCRLEEVVLPGPVIQLSPIWSDGRQLYDTVCSLGLEGVMAKRRLSRYTPGRRSPAWLKIKPRQVQRLGIPCIDLGRKTKRYVSKDVQAWLDTYRRQPRLRFSLSEPKSQ